MCAVCRKVWCEFVGVRVCCVWDSLVWVWRSECFTVFRRVWYEFVGVSVCCVWNSLVWVCGSECVLCVGQFGVGLGE